MPTPAASSSERALKEHLERDAPLREASVARFMAFACTVSALLSLSLGPVIGWPLTFGLLALLVPLTGYYAGLLVLLRRGWFHPAVPWVNVALEVSGPAIIFVVDLSAHGPLYALTAPPLAIWGTLVAASALRGSRPLAVMAGLLAGGEYVALYFLLARHQLPPDALVTLGPAMITIRGFLLACGGLMTAAFAGHLNRRAAEALAEVRQRDVLGKYLLGERIGAGGMAEVYKATYCPEGGFEKTVAVKKVLPSYAQDEAFVSMFRAEAELCSRLNHPNVVQVLDFGRFQDTYFLAMEHVDGLTLRHLIKASKSAGLPLPAVTWLGMELFAALDYVHRRAGPDGRPLGLVHRDVNPPNILVSVAGEVKLTDFGIARAAEGAGLTNAGMIKGKPGYLAPEQIELKPLDERADLFAAGVTLHEALTGRHLYPSTHDAPSLFQVLQVEVRPPSALRSEVPPELDTLVMRLLAREKDQRVPTAAHAQALLASFRGAAAAQPEGKRLLAEAVAQARANGPISQLVTGPSDAATVPAG